MKKLLAFILLSTYTLLMTVALSPIGLAAETNSGYELCNFNNSNYVQVFETESDYEEYKKTKSFAAFEEDLGASFADEEGNAKGTCGEPNSLTGYLEKGDCSANGDLVTEITEVVGSEVESGDSRIITVYKGSCCLYAVKETDQCKDSRYIYTEEYSTCTDDATNCERRQWIISQSGAGIIKVYVKQLYRWAAATVGFIAVVTIIVSGIQISISGVSGDISSAKNRILQSIAGLVLLFLSGIILYTINPDFFS